MKWTQKQMRTVGKIAYVAADRRQRLLTKDQIGWLQEKMDEIQRLAKLRNLERDAVDGQRGVCLSLLP